MESLIGSPAPIAKSLDDVEDSDIIDMRNALDAASWTLFDKKLVQDGGSLLRIDYLNIGLIESFDWFATAGLASIFENKELKIPDVGIVKINRFRLEYPRKDDIGESSALLWPAEAQLKKIDYSGALIVGATIIWGKGSGRTGQEDLGNIQLGKIPIMVGSSFCNLTNPELIKTEEDIVRVKECSDDYMGYFVMGGNQKNLISQNYLKPNHEIVITSKMGTTTYFKTVCNIRCKGVDGTMTMHKVFVMTSAVNKIKHSDRRIYVNMPWVRQNAYDSSTTIIGVNAVTIFRLATILIHRINPFASNGSYLYASVPPQPNDLVAGMEAGLNGVPTFGEAARYYLESIREYGGEELWKGAYSYINDTLNEASLEASETDFWNMTTHISSEPKDKKDKPVKSVAEDRSLADRAESLLMSFSQQFMIHIGTEPFMIQMRKLEEYKLIIREQIKVMHRARGVDTSPQEIDLTIQYINQLIELQTVGNPQANKIRQELYNVRGISITAEYITALAFYNEVRNEIISRMKMMAYMCVKVLRVEIGVAALDDRDSLANQMYENAGILMTSRYAAMLRQVEGELKTVTADTNSIRTALTDLGRKIITAEFASNFSKGEWNKRGVDKKRTGVTDIMPASVTVARLAYLRRLSAQTKGHSRNTASRELTGLQPGLICLSETPEGTQCGNVEHLAAAAFITNESYDAKTLAYKLTQLRTSHRRNELKVADIMRKHSLRDNLNGLMVQESKDSTGELFISSRRSPTLSTPMFLDGKPMGWVNGLTFRRRLIGWRREGLLHPHTGIHYTHKVSKSGMISQLKIETTGGRIVQPLIIAEDPQKTVDMLWRIHLNFRDGGETTFEDLIQNGYIEFVDSAELEFLDVAPSASVYLKAVQDGLPERYDHIMLNPAFLMGSSANIMPFANMNPVVRNSYFTSMVKQPLDNPHPTYTERAHTSIGKLLTPQVPIVKTDMYDNIFRNDYFGMNVNLLITPNRDGEEDGIVVNQRFLDNGGLSSTKYSAFPVTLEPGQELNFGRDFMETEEDPDRYGRGIIRITRKVATRNDDGTMTITEEPVIVKPHEVLARKTWKRDDEMAFEDVTHDSLRDGIVDRIVWSKSTGSSRIVYIIIKMPDNLWLGDKIASRFSQKGTIARVVKDEDMPYDAITGETADIIVNPQAFPSRMTIGMLAEGLVANAHIFPDKNKNVYIMYRKRGFDIFAPLERIFAVSKKTWEEYQFDDGHVHHVEAPAPDGLPDWIPPTEGAGSMLQPNPILQQEPLPKSDGETLIISSDEVFSHEDMEFLKYRDSIKTFPGMENGLWAIRYYSEDSIRYIVIMGKLGGPIEEVTDQRLDVLYSTYPSLREKIAMVLAVPMNQIEIIPGLYFDLEATEDEEFLNPQRGVRLSNLPEPVQETYVQGNMLTPVATQHVAGYLDSFFMRANITKSLFDFIIPESMRVLNDIILPDSNDVPTTVTLTAGSKFSDLKKNTTSIKARVWTTVVDGNGKVRLGDDGKTPIQRQEIVELTSLEAWTKHYPDSLLIPRENIIGLPQEARKVYSDRAAKIANMRKATIFKEGIDLKDAMDELELMGYERDMKSDFILPRTGKPIEGGIVRMWSYYMPLKHKVKNKMQARGFGKNDSRTNQPIQGRNRGGGLRFNYADALASIKSGAANFVSDRLLDSSGKKDVFVCTNCKEVCYREGAKGAMMGSIVCPLCSTEAEAVKISVPYIFLLERNLLMAAGVRLQVEPDLDDFEDDGPGFNKNKF